MEKDTSRYVGCLLGLVYAAFKKMSNNPSSELNLAT